MEYIGNCPQCEGPVATKHTRFGPRHECRPCGLRSWDFKPLVSDEVHAARRQGHAVFDAVWKRGEEAYPEAIAEGRSPKKFRRITRVRGYRMLAWLTGLPEPRCHFGDNTDLSEILMLIDAAEKLDPIGIRQWWRDRGESWWKSEGLAHADEL